MAGLDLSSIILKIPEDAVVGFDRDEAATHPIIDDVLKTVLVDFHVRKS